MKAKKIVSFIAAMAIATTMAVPATLSFAASTAVTLKHASTDITTDIDATYKAYKIFDGTTSDDGTILSDVKWAEGFNGAGFAKAINMDGKTAAEVAVAMNGANASTAATYATKAAEYKGTSAAISFENGVANLTDGYYVIVGDTSTTGQTSAVSRNILYLAGGKNNKTKTIPLKESIPTVEKKVKDDVNDTWQDITDQQIGEDVTFKLTGTLPEKYSDYTTYTYTFNDTLSAGLTFNSNTVEITAGNAKVDSTKYTVTSTANGDGGTNITISFTDLKTACPGLAYGNDVVVTYKAKLNKDAVVGNPGNPNTVTLTYSNNPESTGTGTTPEDKVTVITFLVDTLKVGEDGTTPLKDASFVLFKEETTVGADSSETTTKKYYKLNDGLVTWVANESDATVLTSGSDGKLPVVKGLKDGTYAFKETAVPDGYNKLTEDLTFTISHEDGEVAEPINSLTVSKTSDAMIYAGATASTGTVNTTIQNTKGKGLPETGGMGRTILYVCGGIVVLGAGVLLITKKRLGKEED